MAHDPDLTTPVFRGKIHLSATWLAVSDPIYANAHLGQQALDPMVVPVHCDWPELLIYTLEDTHGVRALVASKTETLPAELLQPILHGTYYFLDEVGVDSASMGFFDADHLPAAPLEGFNGFHLAADYAVCYAYHGDGVYPIAIWSTNGMPTAIAVLMDRSYFDPDWQDK